MPTLPAETTAGGEVQPKSHVERPVPSAPTPAPPGWYPDPHHVASWRWWSGRAWADHTG
ncbi:DUF2510 domain-containing protein [Nocardia cyriacigeorgica]|uniref:DUF2510 domain-containing protein n=1 Tax=Nocardia cyriacigeorgica TaxID=135487 RepID=UPI003CC7D8E3